MERRIRGAPAFDDPMTNVERGELHCALGRFACEYAQRMFFDLQ